MDGIIDDAENGACHLRSQRSTGSDTLAHLDLVEIESTLRGITDDVHAEIIIAILRHRDLDSLLDPRAIIIAILGSGSHINGHIGDRGRLTRLPLDTIDSARAVHLLLESKFIYITGLQRERRGNKPLIGSIGITLII